MVLELYSDRNGPDQPRIQENFSETSTTSIIDLIILFMQSNYFNKNFNTISKSFHYNPNDYFYLYVKSNTGIDLSNAIILKKSISVPTLNFLDLIELLFRLLHNTKKITSFYLQEVNKIFYKNGMIYEIEGNGKIFKKISDEQIKQINQSLQLEFNDIEQSNLISQACFKFKSHIIEERKIAVDKLWDAFERIKTQLDGDKKQSTAKLIKSADVSLLFKELINDEMIALTKIGNNFQIRHYETDKIPLNNHDEIDYLFHRCLSMINLLGANLIRIQNSVE